MIDCLGSEGELNRGIRIERFCLRRLERFQILNFDYRLGTNPSSFLAFIFDYRLRANPSTNICLSIFEFSFTCPKNPQNSDSLQAREPAISILKRSRNWASDGEIDTDRQISLFEVHPNWLDSGR